MLPFALVSVVHLVAKLAEATGWDRGTKPLLMPTLAFGFVVLGRRLSRTTLVLVLAGLLCSWIGDLTIGDLVVGLSFFLLAHVAYVVLFLATFDRPVSWWGLLAVPWFVLLLLALGDSLGGFFGPIVVYGLVLGVMAAVSTRGNLLTVLGAVLFVASDSLLAFRLFTELMQGAVADAVIMALYVGAQAALATGVLLRDDPRVPVLSRRRG
jgi:uncharacterized membrane protein YhhN